MKHSDIDELAQALKLFMQAQSNTEACDLASFFVEGALGWHPVPLGLVQGFRVDGSSYDVPMASEEASVLAAARFVGGLSARFGGIQTTAMQTITKGQALVRSHCALDEVTALAESYAKQSNEAFPQMQQRKGGLRAVAVQAIDAGDISTESSYPLLYSISLSVDCRDAMGAHRCTDMADFVGNCFERDKKGEKIAAILSNEGSNRLVRASMTIPISLLRRISAKQDAASRLALMLRWAKQDSARAITHNKGIMNGVSAVLLASGNDTRANEAAVHAYAGRSGSYQPLSWCRIEGDTVVFLLEMPVILGTVGLAIEAHPGARVFYRTLSKNGARKIDAPRLASVVAGIGLAQNLAALAALIGGGIQKGHGPLHKKRTIVRAALDTLF